MAGSRVPIVVGILAIAGGIAWFALRGDQGSNDLTVAASGSSTGSGKAAISAPEGPSLRTGSNAFEAPLLVDGAPAIDAPSHRDVFVAQPRDPRWSRRMEDDLRTIVARLKLTTVESVECHTDQCELTLAGPADAVEASVAQLEGAKGLPRVASSLLLGGPERTGDKLTLRVYALFDRTPEP